MQCNRVQMVHLEEKLVQHKIVLNDRLAGSVGEKRTFIQKSHSVKLAQEPATEENYSKVLDFISNVKT